METVIRQAVHGMQEKGFTVVELETAEQAAQYLLAHIPAKASVGVGGSVSVRDTDILALLSHKDCAVYQSWGEKPEDVPMIRQKSRTADIYLTSANAVTRDGRLVLLDGIGNRVGAVVDGPQTVYFIISHSKVVDGGINTAIARIKQTACPQNARRLGLQTACAKTGICKAQDCEQSICRFTVAVDRAPKNREFVVLFVAQALGY